MSLAAQVTAVGYAGSPYHAALKGPFSATTRVSPAALKGATPFGRSPGRSLIILSNLDSSRLPWVLPLDSRGWQPDVGQGLGLEDRRTIFQGQDRQTPLGDRGRLPKSSRHEESQCWNRTRHAWKG